MGFGGLGIWVRVNVGIWVRGSGYGKGKRRMVELVWACGRGGEELEWVKRLDQSVCRCVAALCRNIKMGELVENVCQEPNEKLSKEHLLRTVGGDHVHRQYSGEGRAAQHERTHMVGM